jgi:hypothetical protein
MIGGQLPNFTTALWYAYPERLRVMARRSLDNLPAPCGKGANSISPHGEADKSDTRFTILTQNTEARLTLDGFFISIINPNRLTSPEGMPTCLLKNWIYYPTI